MAPVLRFSVKGPKDRELNSSHPRGVTESRVASTSASLWRRSPAPVDSQESGLPPRRPLRRSPGQVPALRAGGQKEPPFGDRTARPSALRPAAPAPCRKGRGGRGGKGVGEGEGTAAFTAQNPTFYRRNRELVPLPFVGGPVPDRGSPAVVPGSPPGGPGRGAGVAEGWEAGERVAPPEGAVLLSRDPGDGRSGRRDPPGARRGRRASPARRASPGAEHRGVRGGEGAGKGRKEVGAAPTRAPSRAKPRLRVSAAGAAKEPTTKTETDDGGSGKGAGAGVSREGGSGQPTTLRGPQPFQPGPGLRRGGARLGLTDQRAESRQKKGS